jgi:1,4-dihydroxy-2-naphthoate octaprenyltransferase
VSVAAWLRASRLPAQSYLALPLLLGQALHVAAGGALSPAILVLTHLFGVLDQLAIVYANDVADRETDALNTTATIFSGGSRVLVEGALSARALGVAALVAASLALGCGVALACLFGRWLCVPGAALALLLLWLYSYPPARLSYRGGGELLQMLGVGALLPPFGYHAQSGELRAFPWSLLAVLLPAQLACALATTLPDEPSDRASRKRTAAVLLGPRAVRAVIALLQVVTVAQLHLHAARWLRGLPRAWLALPAGAGLAGLGFARTRPGSAGMTIGVGLHVLFTLGVVAILVGAILWSGA